MSTLVSPRPYSMRCVPCGGEGRKTPLPTIPAALEFRRDQYGLTAMAFAKLIGLHRSHYSEIVSGKRRLPLNARIAAHKIGVPAEVLLQP